MQKRIKKYLLYLAAVFLLSALTAIYVVQETRVTGSSMEPLLRDGESVLVNKLAYRKKEPDRFDVIIFRYLYKEDEYYIKRVIGLPGETVQIRDSVVYIDGERLSDPYGSQMIEEAGRAAEPVVLGENEYFVLGDNRNHSSDSRGMDVGNVRRVQILGKAVRKLRGTGSAVYGGF